jgi:hypothetical protein
MTATVAPKALFPIFESPTGKEYSLVWYNGTGPGQKGLIRMTDLLFNHYFWPAAFGLDGKWDTRTYTAAGSVKMIRRIGGPSVTYDRGGYTLRVLPTYRSNAIDSGTQLYVRDGKDLWNFEITGRITEFRIWLENQGGVAGNLKRPFILVGETGVSSSVIPVFSQNP